jgi:hypothetical protein
VDILTLDFRIHSWLKAKAHKLEPVVHISAKGPHELIKVRAGSLDEAVG